MRKKKKSSAQNSLRDILDYEIYKTMIASGKECSNKKQ